MNTAIPYLYSTIFHHIDHTAAFSVAFIMCFHRPQTNKFMYVNTHDSSLPESFLRSEAGQIQKWRFQKMLALNLFIKFAQFSVESITTHQHEAMAR
jgi:hypothetical protein